MSSASREVGGSDLGFLEGADVREVAGLLLPIPLLSTLLLGVSNNSNNKKEIHYKSINSISATSN